MSEAWISTLDTATAATFGTLGVPIRLQTTLIEQTGQRTTRFHMALSSLDRKYDTRKIRSEFKRGRLEATDPGHPFITGMRALQCRSSILALQKTGSPIRLVQVPGTELWQYVPSSNGLPGTTGHLEIIETTDIKIVAALAIIGIPLLSLSGSDGHHLYRLPRYGPRRADSIPPIDGLHLMQSWRRDKEEIPFEHPFAQAARTLHNRERLVDAVRREIELVLLIKPRTAWKSALIKADAPAAAFDKVKAHFDR